MDKIQKEQTHPNLVQMFGRKPYTIPNKKNKSYKIKIHFSSWFNRIYISVLKTTHQNQRNLSFFQYVKHRIFKAKRIVFWAFS